MESVINPPESTPLLFDTQMRVIGERWPTLHAHLMAGARSFAPPPDMVQVQGLETTWRIGGLQFGSRHDAARETRLQGDQLPDAEVLYLYGPGLGSLARHLLSSRPRLRRLEVRLLNAGLFAQLLQVVDHTGWLQDPRVHLGLAADDSEARRPFFAHPPELSLADNASARIRDRLIHELTLPFVRRTFSAGNPLLAERLQQNRTLLEQDHDVAELFGRASGRTAFVIGTGPTLEQHLGLLARVAQAASGPERPLMIAVDTALAPLARVGVLPDFAVAFDYRIAASHLEAQALADVPLVYAPVIAGDVLRTWRAPRYSAYSASPVYDPVRQRFPKGELFEGGSVIHPAVDLAVRMGCREVTLFGTDFCFPHGKTHAHWPAGALRAEVATAQHWVLNGRGERVPTNPNFASYLVELERYIAHHPGVRFFQTSRDGARIAGCAGHPEYMR